MRISPREAFYRVQAAFPIDGYMVEPAEAYLTVTRTVEKYLPDGGTVFDFGSGPMDKTAQLSLMGYQCFAFDDLADPWHQKPGMHDRIEAYAGRIGVRFSRTNSLPPDGVDMIVLNAVIEHLRDSPRELLTELVEKIRDGGYLFITVPNAGNIKKRIRVLMGGTNHQEYDLFYWYPGPFRGHIREYVRADLVALARNLGLPIAELRSYHSNIRRLPPALRPLYRLATMLFSGWRDSWLLVLQKPADWRPVDLSESELRQILARHSADI